jgi:hypothetical protein
MESQTEFGMRIYAKRQGGHTHLRIFIGPKNSVSYGCAGEFIVRNEEFEAWRDGRISVEFREEGQQRRSL